MKKSKSIILCIVCMAVIAGFSFTALAASSYGTLSNSVSITGNYAVDYVWSSAYENMLGISPSNFDYSYGWKYGYYDYITGVSAGQALGQYVYIGRTSSHGYAVIDNYANWSLQSTKTVYY